MLWFQRTSPARFLATTGAAAALAGLILGIYRLALTRAWNLLGAQRLGVSDWLSPLRDMDK